MIRHVPLSNVSLVAVECDPTIDGTAVKRDPGRTPVWWAIQHHSRFRHYSAVGLRVIPVDRRICRPFLEQTDQPADPDCDSRERQQMQPDSIQLFQKEHLSAASVQNYCRFLYHETG